MVGEVNDIVECTLNWTEGSISFATIWDQQRFDHGVAFQQTNLKTLELFPAISFDNWDSVVIVSNSVKDKLVNSDKFETFKRYTAFPPERRDWTNKNG